MTAELASRRDIIKESGESVPKPRLTMLTRFHYRSFVISRMTSSPRVRRRVSAPRYGINDHSLSGRLRP